MRQQREASDWAGQWLKVWPTDDPEETVWAGWITPDRWALSLVEHAPEWGRVTVAVENAPDDSGFTVVRAIEDSGRVVLEACNVPVLAVMRGQVEGWREPGAQVVVGKSLAGLVLQRPTDFLIA